MHDKVEVPEVVVVLNEMLVGPKEQVRPAGTVLVRLTVPVKPFMPETKIVELAGRLARTARLVGLATTLKSTPATETVVDAVKDPEVPVTVMAPLPVVEPAVIVRVALAFPP